MIFCGQSVLEQRFRYLEIKDAWGTPGEKVAPLPPALGIALTFGKRFSLPASVTPSAADLSYFTPHGPLLVCPGDQHMIRENRTAPFISPHPFDLTSGCIADCFDHAIVI